MTSEYTVSFSSAKLSCRSKSGASSWFTGHLWNKSVSVNGLPAIVNKLKYKNYGI